MKSKAQGAMEYLLIIAAAVLIVALVITVMSGGVTTGQDQGTTAQNNMNTQTTKLNCLKDCNYYGACTDTNHGCGKYSDICRATAGATCIPN